MVQFAPMLDEKPSEHAPPVARLRIGRPWADVLRSVAAILISVASVIVSYVAVRVQSSTAKSQNENARAQIQLQQDNAKRQDETERRAFAATMVQFIKCSDDLQRVVALGLVPPEYTKLFVAAISQKCPNLTSKVRTEIVQIQEQSIDRERVNNFLRLLANARQYKNRGFDGEAARLFSAASTLITDSSKVNTEELSKARQAFGEGKFKEAADRFDAAFSAFPDGE